MPPRPEKRVWRLWREILWAQKEESGSPLDAAKDFADADKGVETAEEALQGACDIIAERDIR